MIHTKPRDSFHDTTSYIWFKIKKTVLIISEWAAVDFLKFTNQLINLYRYLCIFILLISSYSIFT